MTVILSESLLHDSARVLTGSTPVSYYQFRSFSSLIDAIVLHDKALIFEGTEDDTAFIASYDSLKEIICSDSDFKIDVISRKNRGDSISDQDIHLFSEICTDLYKYSLGITIDEIFIKRKKDRTEEDMSEHIENSFLKMFPNFDPSQTSETIYSL